jgi:hypothetical protein
MIVSSEILWDLPQADGSRTIREEHTDDQGNVYSFDYMAETDTDVNAKLAARAAELNGSSS